MYGNVRIGRRFRWSAESGTPKPCQELLRLLVAGKGGSSAFAGGPQEFRTLFMDSDECLGHRQYRQGSFGLLGLHTRKERAVPKAQVRDPFAALPSRSIQASGIDGFLRD